MINSNLATARRISALERGELSSTEVNNTHNASYVVGISGPPGVGKSVLVGELALLVARTGHRVAVLAVDPSSPITGGAVLADRVRMPLDFEGLDVFIRSLASRGALGGLSQIVASAVHILSDEGYSIVFVETVGVGQNEIAIMDIANTVILVQTPGAGDEAQGLKAGILEIADIFVVNKMDHPNAEFTLCTIRDIANSSAREGWQPTVIPTVALKSEGIEKLWESIQTHKKWSDSVGATKRQHTRRIEMQLMWSLWCTLRTRLPLTEIALNVADGSLSFNQAIKRLENYITEMECV